VTHTITLVTDVYLSKQEALHVLSEVLSAPFDTSDPSNATLVLDGGVVLAIEVPKFGEDLPLTIDISGDSLDAAQAVADMVIRTVTAGLSWSVSVVG
jgi:hypothetical protein